LFEDRRRFERKATTIRVEMKHPAFGTVVGFAKDISDGGAQVSIENPPTPPVGTIVEVTFKKRIGSINDEPVQMKVMHSGKNNIGLMFLPK